MLDRNFVLFITSFVTVFTSLVLISQYLNTKLKAAGYDISRIILIGLPTNNSYDSTPATKFAIPWGLSSNMTTQSTFDLKDFQEKGYAQAAALILAVLSSLFIYFKFGPASKFRWSLHRATGILMTSLTRTQAGAQSCGVERVYIARENHRVSEYGRVCIFMNISCDVELTTLLPVTASHYLTPMTFSDFP